MKKNKSYLPEVHLIARSIRNKQEERRLIFDSLEFKFDAILFTETWLNTNDDIPFFVQWKSVGLSRKKGGCGGTVVYNKQGHLPLGIGDVCGV